MKTVNAIFPSFISLALIDCRFKYSYGFSWTKVKVNFAQRPLKAILPVYDADQKEDNENGLNDVLVQGSFDDEQPDEAFILEMVEQRKLLAQKIQETYSKVIHEDEKNSMVAHSTAINAVETIGFIGAEKEDGQKEIQRRIQRALKPRAYPLFLMEKAAETIEAMLPPNRLTAVREKIVVVGTGWSSASFLRRIDTSLFDVFVISPRNYFIFTPMLAGSAVGTVEYRSITMPIRSINPNVNFIEAATTDIDLENKAVSCVGISCDGSTPCSIEEFMVPYDRLLFAVGTQISTFGIPGVKENCCFLKDIDDARKIRRAIISLLESANMPEVSDEEKKKLLTFAVIGTGPSGIEFSGELRDFVENEVARFYPNLLRHVKIKLFDFAKSVLGPFDKTLQDAAVDHLTQEMVWRNDKIASWLPENYRIVEISLGNGVKEVKRDRILLNDGKVVPFGLCLWAGGNGPVPITLDLIKKLGKEQQDLQQVARGRLVVDPWMRVIGGDGDILAVGDCTCFSCNDKTKTLPATAQVASQQADYLATVLSKGINMTMVKNDGVVLPPLRNKMETTVSESIASFAMNNDDFVAPFQYLDLGILAYIGGDEALAQLKLHPNVTTGITGRLGFGIWQSVYMAKQLSWKNQLLIMFDWIKTKAFGRDITQL